MLFLILKCKQGTKGVMFNRYDDGFLAIKKEVNYNSYELTSFYDALEEIEVQETDQSGFGTYK